MSTIENEPPPPRNRLSIAHLMLWTLGSAIILACYRALLADEDARSRWPAVLPAYNLGYSLCLGAQVGSVLLFGWRWLRGVGGFPTQPGHWLLLVEGISALLMWGGLGLFELLRKHSGISPDSWDLCQLPNYVVTFAGYMLALVALGHERGGWKVAVVCLMLQYGFVAWFVGSVEIWSLSARGSARLVLTGRGEEFLNGLNYLFGVLTWLAVAIASLIDSDRRSRDFLHWTGVIMLLASIGLQLSSAR